MNLYPFFKNIAFQIDSEKIHEHSMKLFNKFPRVSSFFPSATPCQKYTISDGHMQWSFPVGLAAGFDKNAQAIEFFSRCGFGAVEIGTVTKKAQEGNPRPRIWRLPEESSLRNAMGFPNEGAQKIKKNILNSHYDTCLGINIGKNKLTGQDETPAEYAWLYEYFAPVANYLVINISSPNTPGLRDLQSKEAFRKICLALQDKRSENPKPLYLKIAPDLAKDDIIDLVDLTKEFSFSGIIATNTTIQHSYGQGGVSGQNLRPLARQVRKIVCEATRETKDLSVIAVGGIESFDDLIEFWQDGGTFAQIYTSFVYHGPKILKDFQSKIDLYLKQVGLSNVQDILNEIRRSH